MHPFALLVIAVIILLGLNWFRRQPPAKRRIAAAQGLLVVIILALVYLSVSGRLHWLGMLTALALPFVQKLVPLMLKLLPFISIWQHTRRQSPGTARPASTGAQSRVHTVLLEMILDHASGLMYGSVLQGPLQGRELSSLSEHEFIQLLRYCREQDHDSARLLETYLDKRFGDSWRADDDTAEDERMDTSANTPMSVTDAYAILGLEPGASRDEIIQAHRRLIQKNHPDRGGSPWLAARINEARTLLLDREH